MITDYNNMNEYIDTDTYELNNEFARNFIENKMNRIVKKNKIDINKKRDNLIQKNLYYSNNKAIAYIESVDSDDTVDSNDSDDTWYERLYRNYDDLSEISDLTDLSDLSVDSLVELLHDRYNKAKNLIKYKKKLNRVNMYDYKFIKMNNRKINQEIIAEMHKPSRIIQYLNLYNLTIDSITGYMM